MDEEPDDIEIPYLFLADGAQSVGGKLYVLGGGWDRIIVPQVPGKPSVSFSIALGIRVPWTHTNRKFALALELIDADGERVGDELGLQLETGRPPGLKPGTPQNVPLGIGAHPEFPVVGAYTFVVKIDGAIKGKVGFDVASMQPIVTTGPQ
jgi:hypothetical protein